MLQNSGYVLGAYATWLVCRHVQKWLLYSVDKPLRFNLFPVKGLKSCRLSFSIIVVALDEI